MSYRERHQIDVTTSNLGAATAYSPVITGDILCVEYDKDDFADGVDVTISLESGVGVLLLTDQNASGTWYPRTQVHGTTGTGLTYDGTRVIAAPVPAANDRVKIVVASGGDTKSGTFYVTVG